MKRLLSVLAVSLILMAGCRSGQKAKTTGVPAREKPYLASAIRDPFHKPACRWAKKIADGNLVGYDTRQDAIDDGHRPCKVCQP